VGKSRNACGMLMGCLKKRNNLKPLGIDRIILKLTINKEDGVDWIYLAQDRDRRRAVVDTAMNRAVV